MWENTTPSTELLRDFCAGIGTLQLGVVLISNCFLHMFFVTSREVFKMANQNISKYVGDQGIKRVGKNLLNPNGLM